MTIIGICHISVYYNKLSVYQTLWIKYHISMVFCMQQLLMCRLEANN